MKTWMFCAFVLACLYCVQAIECTTTYGDVFKAYGEYPDGDILLCFEGHVYDFESGFCYAFPNSNNNDPNQPFDFAKAFRVKKPHKVPIRSELDNWYPGQKLSLTDYQNNIKSTIDDIQNHDVNRVHPVVYEPYPHKKQA